MEPLIIETSAKDLTWPCVYSSASVPDISVWKHILYDLIIIHYGFLNSILFKTHPVKYFTDCSKAVLLLWIFHVFVLSCVCYVFVRVCLYVLFGHLLGKGWPLGSRLWCLLWVCHFPIGILGQVWYFIVLIRDLCTLTYFVKSD